MADTYVVLVVQHFTDPDPAQALARARNVLAHTKTLAQQSTVFAAGGPAESASHATVLQVEADGSTTPLGVEDSWHVDGFGIVRDGLPADTDGDYPPWIQPTGAQDAYPLTTLAGDPTRVTHDGQTWQNTTAANVWEPGVFGWETV